MGAPSDTRTLVLHGLRLKGFAAAEAVADLVALEPGTVAAELTALCDDALVVHREGRLTGFALTPAGKAEHSQRLAAELDGAAVRADVDACYRRFLALNPVLLEVCTRWQLREVDGQHVANDHTDAAHDAEVLTALGEVHAGVTAVLADLTALLARFGRYQPALDDAIGRVRAGDLDAVTKPIVPSYHTIWFELHEDLLATLGIERSSERSSEVGA